MKENEAISRMRYRVETATHNIGKGVDGKAYEDMEMAIKALEEIQQYRAIGTVEECREARERQRAKKPNKMEYKPLFDFGWRYACPSCGCAVGANEYDGEFTQQDDYCDTCGQKLDWSE